MERDLANAGLHMLIEKPISMRPAEEVERLAKVCSAKLLPSSWFILFTLKPFFPDFWQGHVFS